jgi:hypothetical protein
MALLGEDVRAVLPVPGARSSVLKFDVAKNATVDEGDFSRLTSEVEPGKEEAAVPQIGAGTGSVIKSLQSGAWGKAQWPKCLSSTA